MYRRETDDGYFEITDEQRMFIIREYKAAIEKARYRRNRDQKKAEQQAAETARERVAG